MVPKVLFTLVGVSGVILMLYVLSTFRKSKSIPSPPTTDKGDEAKITNVVDTVGEGSIDDLEITNEGSSDDLEITKVVDAVDEGFKNAEKAGVVLNID
jgi:hypothetical protein